MPYYKVLDENCNPVYGGRGKWTPGQWRSVRGELIPCERGLHLCTLEQLPLWLNSAVSVWRAEIHPKSEVITCGDKVVVRKARVTERLPWDERTARLFAADCAERVLHLFEAAVPGDDRPRRAIEAARAYARGEIGDEALKAARGDAWAAAEAARYTPRDATERIAGYAAYAAACAAAEYAVHSITGYAAEAASWAAEDAEAASWAAGDAARERERRWQVERLAHYLRVVG